MYKMGQRIAALRKQAQLTQEELAENVGVSHQFFSCVERGEKNIRAINLLKLSKALGVSADYLLVGLTVQNCDNEKVVILQEMVEKLDHLDLNQLNGINEVINALVKVFRQP